MVMNYNIPVKTEEGENQPFTIEQVVTSLANNKHNDCTTTYYLLHKKWAMESLEEDDDYIKQQEARMISISPSNFQNIIFKLKSMIEINQTQDKVKNLIKIESEKDKIMTCSASFQVKLENQIGKQDSGIKKIIDDLNGTDISRGVV